MSGSLEISRRTLSPQGGADSYDEVPAVNFPVPHSQPERLAVFARLYGMQPAEASQARVLELGCAGGRNLIPLAERYPQATFVGIDRSRRQIGFARETVVGLGLKNVELRQVDLLDVGEELGTFDYILAQSVYGLVDSTVRDKVLAICRQCLAPQGVAYVGYNTYPGWHVHEMLRAMMLYDARGSQNTGQMIGRARLLLEFLKNSLTEQNNSYDAMLQVELQLLLQQPDAYLRHEHLEDVNQGVYFEDFIAHAQRHQLQMLGDCTVGIRKYDYLEPQAEHDLEGVTDDPIRKEQYRDIVRNRAFRQTLLCHQAIDLPRTLDLSKLPEVYVDARLAPENPDFPLKSSVAEIFTAPNGMRVTTSVPLVKAAIAHLGSIWPNCITWSDLVAAACGRLEAAGSSSTPVPESEVLRLEENLLHCCVSGVMELHSHASLFTTTVSDRPLASPLARWQAQRGDVVTSRRHESIRLDFLDLQILRLLDGTWDSRQLLDHLVTAASEGRITVWEANTALVDREQIARGMGTALPSVLDRLARCALLIG